MVKATSTLLAFVLVMSGGCAVERRTANAGAAQTASSTVRDTTPTNGVSAISTRSVERPQVALVDSSAEGDPGDVAVILYRVQVKSSTRTDTIPGARTMTLPGVGADGHVYFFAFDRDGFLTHAYSYDPDTRQLTDIQIPPDIEFNATHLTVSPDARYIAYIAPDSVTSYTHGRVLSWPAGSLVAQTPAEPGYDSEIDYNDLRWIDADRAEFVYHSGRAIEPGAGHRELWIHAMVAASTHEVRVDSLASKPEWNR